MASASLLRDSEPDLEFFLLRLAPQVLRKPTHKSFDRFGQHEVKLKATSSGIVLIHTYAFKPSSLVLAAIRRIATSPIPLVYLRSSWTKANLPRGRGAKPKGLIKNKAAGLPKGDSK